MTEPAGITASTTWSPGTGRAIDPAMATRDDPGGAVGLDREVVERPHRVHDDVREVARQRVHAGVVVEDLRLLAGTDLDARRRRQLVVLEHPVEHAEEQRVDRSGVEGARLGEQRVDAPRVVALEVVSAERRGSSSTCRNEAFASATSSGDQTPSTMQ